MKKIIEDLSPEAEIQMLNELFCACGIAHYRMDTCKTDAEFNFYQNIVNYLISIIIAENFLNKNIVLDENNKPRSLLDNFNDALDQYKQFNINIENIETTISVLLEHGAKTAEQILAENSVHSC